MVSEEKLDKALYLVRSDDTALPGFQAYRYAVLRVPGLWWMVPLFYIPVLSRLIGTPIYDWIAANRARLSRLGVFRRVPHLRNESEPLHRR